LLDVEPRLKVVCEEAFRPVITVHRYGQIDQVFGEINSGTAAMTTYFSTLELPFVTVALTCYIMKS
jgi:acyl-CoA reductase-like NAD-dependent aldehyde dehydrogenase